MKPLDTHPKAAAIQAEIYRRMSPEERFKIAAEMSDSMRSLALAGLRSRRPDLKPCELRMELMRLMYGRMLTE